VEAGDAPRPVCARARSGRDRETEGFAVLRLPGNSAVGGKTSQVILLHITG